MESGNAPASSSYDKPTPRRRQRSERNPRLIVGATVAALLGIGILLLSRFVAETRDASLILGAVWFAVVGAGVYAFSRSEPEMRNVAFASFAAAALAIGAVGYWTGFRETNVDESIVAASETATGAELDAALAGDGSTDGGAQAGGSSGGSGGSSGAAAVGGGSAEGSSDQSAQKKEKKPKPSGPVSLLKGGFTGVDGHDGTGKAEVVKDGNERTLQFTNFDVDPGPNIEVYLTPNAGDVSDRVELGKLKGTQGNQQYSIPGNADLGKYDSVVLYCTPFTVRVAVAELG